MRRKRVPAAVLAAALSACVVEPELLNSERIESQFGNYGIEVVSYQDGVRRSRLYSTDAGTRTCRTYAVVKFHDNVPALIGTEHQQILTGASIGATYKGSGWRVFKETRHIGSIAVGPDPHAVYASMRLAAMPPLAMHVYRLLLRKQKHVIDYATIIELHHPDYLTPDDVKTLFAVDRMATPTAAELDDWISLIREAP